MPEFWQQLLLYNYKKLACVMPYSHRRRTGGASAMDRESGILPHRLPWLGVFIPIYIVIKFHTMPSLRTLLLLCHLSSLIPVDGPVEQLEHPEHFFRIRTYLLLHWHKSRLSLSCSFTMRYQKKVLLVVTQRNYAKNTWHHPPFCPFFAY